LLEKIQNLPMMENPNLIYQFYEFMKQKGSSERHIVNNLKVITNFHNFFERPKIIAKIEKEDNLNFLDNKIKSPEIDPEIR
jgi:hypothetical protein